MRSLPPPPLLLFISILLCGCGSSSSGVTKNLDLKVVNKTPHTQLVNKAIDKLLYIYALNGLSLELNPSSPRTLYFVEDIPYEGYSGMTEGDEAYVAMFWIEDFPNNERERLVGEVAAHELGHVFGIRGHRENNCANIMSNYANCGSGIRKEFFDEEQLSVLETYN